MTQQKTVSSKQSKYLGFLHLQIRIMIFLLLFLRFHLQLYASLIIVGTGRQTSRHHEDGF